MAIKTKPIKIAFIVTVGTLAGCLTKSMWTLTLPDSAHAYLSSTRLIQMDTQGRTFAIDTAQIPDKNPAPRIRFVSAAGKPLWETTLDLAPFDGPAGNKKEEFSLRYSAVDADALVLAAEVSRCEYIAHAGSWFPQRVCDAGRTDVSTITAEQVTHRQSLPVAGLYAQSIQSTHIIAPNGNIGTDAYGQPKGIWAYDQQGQLLWRHDYPDYQNNVALSNNTTKIITLDGIVIIHRNISLEADSGYQLLALDIASGTRLWQQEYHGVPRSRLLGSDESGRLYLEESTDTGQKLKAIDTQGAPLWEKSFAAILPAENNYSIGEAAITDNNTCYAYREIGADILERNMVCFDNGNGDITLNTALPYPANSSNDSPYSNFIKTQLKPTAKGDILVYDDATTGTKVEGILFRINPVSGTATSPILSQQIADVADYNGNEVRELLRGTSGLLLNNYALEK